MSERNMFESNVHCCGEFVAVIRKNKTWAFYVKDLHDLSEANIDNELKLKNVTL